MRVETRTGVRVYLLNRNMWDTVIIVEEVNLPHPGFNFCEMLLLWAVLNGCHPNTTKCTKGVGRKWNKMSVEEIQESTEQYFRAYVLPLNSVPLLNKMIIL